MSHSPAPEHLFGLALSGGGACCAAQIGALQAWQEAGIRPDIIAGTSGGSIVGALYSYGLSPRDILKVFSETNLFSFSHLTFRQPGLLDITSFKVLEDYLPENNFQSLSIPLIITATDLENGTLKHFSEGPLHRCIQASAAFPGVFAPVNINGVYHADGGILESIPIQPLRSKCKVVAAVDVNPSTPVQQEELQSSRKVVNRAIRLLLSGQRSFTPEQADLFLSPPELFHFGVFSMDAVEELYAIGYEAARKKLDSLKALLAQHI